MLSAHTTQSNACRYRKLTLLAGLFAGIVVCAPRADADPQGGPSKQASPPATAGRAVVVPRSERAEMFYARRFGVDHLQVRSTASGNSLQFRYRVLDAEKAKLLNDKRATPYMLDWQTGNRLQVPTLEKIGTLRQMATPEVGREYWMVFSNPGKLVNPGQKVDVVVGAVRLEGLTVE